MHTKLHAYTCTGTQVSQCDEFIWGSNWIEFTHNLTFSFCIPVCACVDIVRQANSTSELMKPFLKILLHLKLKCQSCVFITVFLCIFIEQTRYIPKYVKIQKQQPEPIAAYTVNLLVWCLRGRKQCLCCLYPVLMSWHPPRPVISVFISTNTNTFNQRPPHITDYHHVSLSMGTCVSCGVLKLDVLPSFNPLLNKAPILTLITAAVWLPPTLTLFTRSKLGQDWGCNSLKIKF